MFVLVFRKEEQQRKKPSKGKIGSLLISLLLGLGSQSRTVYYGPRKTGKKKKMGIYERPREEIRCISRMG